MDMLMTYISPELLVLVPVLYLVGAGIKRSSRVPNTSIPLLLGLCGAALATLWVFATTPVVTPPQSLLAAFTGVTQGILCAGASVYASQLGKQQAKAEEQAALVAEENTDEGE